MVSRFEKEKTRRRDVCLMKSCGGNFKRILWGSLEFVKEKLGICSREVCWERIGWRGLSWRQVGWRAVFFFSKGLGWRGVGRRGFKEKEQT